MSRKRSVYGETDKPVRATKLLPGFTKKGFLNKIEFLISEILILKGREAFSQNFTLWREKVETFLCHAIGDKMAQVADFTGINYFPPIYASGMETNSFFYSGLDRAETVLKNIKEEVEEYFPDDAVAINGDHTIGTCIQKVFIVHGHDETLRVKVVSALNKLGLEPIVLRDQPNRFRTILEKFEDYADVGFAVVLLTSDDIGYDKAKPGTEKGRARQNVVLELGYFLGKLGRNRLMAISDPGVELPGDISGVVYTDPRNDAQWQVELVRELKAAGYNVDFNRLF